MLNTPWIQWATLTVLPAVLWVSLHGATRQETRPRPDNDSSRELYFKADAKGQACVRCHTPDAIEFRVFNFNPSDVVRRARNHLTTAEADRLATFLLKDHRKNGLDPLTARPYQPGGILLAGNTASQRDSALGQELVSTLPELMVSDVTSPSLAARARQAILDLDPRRLPVGIDTSRVSEDIFHGRDHASMADWFPDTPIPETPEFVKARAAYIAQPSEGQIASLLTAVRHLKATTALEQLSIFKYASLLIWEQALIKGGLDGVYKMVPLERWNPLWLVAESARLNSEADALQLGVPSDILAKKSGGPSIAQQMRALRLSWMWMGWTIDPSLFHSEGTKQATIRGDYFVRALQEDGPYPIHTLLFLTKKVIEQGYREGVWPYKVMQHFELQYTYLLIDGDLFHREPQEPGQQVLFRKLATNSFRLSLYSVLEDVARTGGCVRPESQLNQIGYIREYFKAIGAPSADLTLCDEAYAALKSARVDDR